MEQPMVSLKRHNIEDLLQCCPKDLAEAYNQLDDSQDDTPSLRLPSPTEVQYLQVTGPPTGKTLQEDVTYIIIKTEGLEEYVEQSKKRLNSQTRQIRMTSDGKPVNVNGPFECMQPSSFIPNGTCHQIFFNCCEYSLHYREEHTKRRKAALRCQVCEKHLDPEVNPKVYGNQEQHPCNYCGKVFEDPEELSEHNRMFHVKLRPFQCEVCHKRFTQQGGLQQHLRMHSGDRPFPCNYCNKKFTQKSGLDQHLRIHTKVKPFHCVVCWKNFSQSVHLKQHMRTHTQIQPFECFSCSRRFKQSSHLNFHLKSHTPEEVAAHEAKAGDSIQPVVFDENDESTEYQQINENAL